MRIKAKSEMELRNLLDGGIYPFVIKNAEEKVSQSGVPMIKLSLEVDGGSRFVNVWDNVMSDGPMEYKLRHLFYSVGLGEMYESENLELRQLVGKRGLCKVFISIDKTGQYQPKNAINDYVTDNVKSNNMKPLPVVEAPFKDDDLPF